MHSVQLQRLMGRHVKRVCNLKGNKKRKMFERVKIESYRKDVQKNNNYKEK